MRDYDTIHDLVERDARDDFRSTSDDLPERPDPSEIEPVPRFRTPGYARGVPTHLVGIPVYADDEEF